MGANSYHCGTSLRIDHHQTTMLQGAHSARRLRTDVGAAGGPKQCAVLDTESFVDEHVHKLLCTRHLALLRAILLRVLLEQKQKSLVLAPDLIGKVLDPPPMKLSTQLSTVLTSDTLCAGR